MKFLLPARTTGALPERPLYVRVGERWSLPTRTGGDVACGPDESIVGVDASKLVLEGDVSVGG
jgi:hypothetical protein